MEKRALIAIVLSILILILYQELVGRFYGPPKESVPPEQIPAPQEAKPVVQESPRRVQPPVESQPAGREAKDLKIETDLYIAILTSRGARLKSLLLKQYRTSVEKDSPPYEMVISKPGVPYPLGVELQGGVPFNDERLVYEVQGGNLNLTGDGEGTLLFQGRIPGGGTLIKKFTFSGSLYQIGLEVSVQGGVGASRPRLTLTTGTSSEEGRGSPVFEGLIALKEKKLVWVAQKELSEWKELSGEIFWAGFGYTYFFFAILPETPANQTLSVKQAGPGFVMSLGDHAPVGKTGKTSYTLFVGPKDIDVLKALGKGVERSIDFGWWGFALIAAPLLQVLRFSHRFTGSYGIDIILLTILIKLILAPLTHKSFVSMKQMQKLQPQMQRIKDKFKDDKEKMNKEIMDLYKRNKVNPLGGCLPMVFQFPVFIGLYNALRTPIDLRHASFLWVKDLSRPDYESLPFTLWEWELGIPILVLLMGASMFAQQWMTPSAGDPNQKRMMMMMPVVFTALFVTFPAGLTTYWLINNLLTIGQQYLINRMTK